jgi:uncharacterized glyoxalase superfamily protein PhnB
MGTNYPDVIPMIAYEDGPKAMDWLSSAFGFRERARMLDKDGRLSHGEMQAGDGVMDQYGKRYRAEDLEGHRWMFMLRS